MGLLDTIRRWVDGDDADDALGRAGAEQNKPRRQAEEFIVTIARAIGEVMKAEAVPLPPDQIVIPPEYIVFVSDEDDREWQGMKRRALEQGLYHVLAEHARDLAGKTKLGTTSFSVELRVDGTLQKNEVRVQHSWEESSSTNKTSITPRKAPPIPAPLPDTQPSSRPTPQPVQQTPLPVTQEPQPVPRPLPRFDETFGDTRLTQEDRRAAQQQVAPTVFGADIPLPVPQPVQDKPAPRIEPQPQIEAADSEATQVKKREFFRLEIWRNNQRLNVLPVFKQEVTIGRKSKTSPSDVQLEGDPEISRPHVILRRDNSGNYWLMHKGKNPTLVNGREAPHNQPYPVMPNEPITICSYLLRIQS